MHIFAQQGWNFTVLQSKHERFFRGGGTFVLLVDTCDYACICQMGGNFDSFWWKKERVVQRGGNGKFVLLVKKTMHVFARRGGNFDSFWWKKERAVQRASLFC